MGSVRRLPFNSPSLIMFANCSRNGSTTDVTERICLIYQRSNWWVGSKKRCQLLMTRTPRLSILYFYLHCPCSLAILIGQIEHGIFILAVSWRRTHQEWKPQVIELGYPSISYQLGWSESRTAKQPRVVNNLIFRSFETRRNKFLGEILVGHYTEDQDSIRS